MTKEYTQADVDRMQIDQNTKEICELDEKKVDKKDFDPVKSIVYGMVGLILISVATAIVTSIIK